MSITNILRESFLWKAIRLSRIIRQHKLVSNMCTSLIQEKETQKNADSLKAVRCKKDITNQTIWQYWAQGYGNVPPLVRKCLDSVDKWKGEFTIVRLTDRNLDEYISLPRYIIEKKEKGIIPLAQFSDILRVCLLSTYGGVWLDATIMLTGPIPQRYADMDFFVYQRDPNEPDKKYWENAYAYYYGWHKDFKVRMLNAVIFAKKESVVIQEIANLLLYYWKEHDELPDYFFFQILYDVLINGKLEGLNCPIVSDCTPHLMQQMTNDPEFKLATKEEILKTITIHKLTYK